MSRLVPLLAIFALGTLACERKEQPPPTPQVVSKPVPAPTQDEPLLIGSVGSLTGSEASFGAPVRDGIAFAIEQVNAAGGVKGRKVELRAYDTQGRLEESVSAVQRLITKDKVLVIIGDVSSTNTMAFADAAQAARVPVVTPSSTHPDVTRKGDYIFRTCFIDPFQGHAMARFARENLKLERVAVLEDTRNAYSIGLSKVFQESFTRLGGTIVGLAGYSKGDTDFRAPLLAVKKLQPQALYVPGTYSEVGVMARQAQELGLKLPFLGGDAWESPRLHELAGSGLEGSYYTNHYSVDNPSPVLQRFLAEYKARYGQQPDVSVALGYDAARVVLAALERAESLTGPAIRDALATTKDFPTASGNITLDAERNPVKPAVILKVQGGRSVFATSMAP
jgi:branched-chain amino acid transport system substrate-binding protein